MDTLSALTSAPWSWLRPWGFALLLVPLLLIASRWLGARRRQALAEGYADAALLPFATRLQASGATRGAIAYELLLWSLLACAVAGPRQSLPGAPGADAGTHRIAVMVLLDAGNPAAASAVGLGAQAQSRLLLRALWPQLHGERLGLMAYGTAPNDAPARLLQLLPPTRDGALFDHFARLATPALFTAPGESVTLPDVLALAQQQLDRQAPGEPHALLLLAGADTPRVGGEAPGELGRRLHAAQLPLFVLALPQLDASLRASLRAVADASGGSLSEVASARTGAAVWAPLYARGIARLPVDAAASRPHATHFRERYGLFLLPAILLMLAGEWWRLPRRRPHRPRGVPIASILLGLLLAMPLARAADTRPWQAWAAWQAGNFALAQQQYAALPGWAARIGEGAAAYRLRRYPQAVDAWQRGVLLADTPAQRFVAFYNLGNAWMHVPGKSEHALQAFRAALRIRPDDPAALRNARLARARYELEHPPYYMVGIARRGPPSQRANFGQQTPETPSQLHALAAQVAAQVTPRDAVPMTGQLDARQAGTGSGSAWQPPALDWDGVDKRVQLLHDDTDLLWRERVDMDSRAARVAAASTPGPPP